MLMYLYCTFRLFDIFVNVLVLFIHTYVFICLFQTGPPPDSTLKRTVPSCSFKALPEVDELGDVEDGLGPIVNSSGLQAKRSQNGDNRGTVVPLETSLAVQLLGMR